MKRFLMVFTILVMSLVALPVFAITESQEATIKEHCSTIKDDLRKIQRTDARTRVYLGSHYETILSKFVVPLNVKLVENSISNVKLVENQSNLVETKTNFANDFIKYQQNLEELVALDCKEEPENFYNKLVVVRQKRKTVEQDVLKMRNLISEHVKLVNELKGKL